MEELHGIWLQFTTPVVDYGPVSYDKHVGIQLLYLLSDSLRFLLGISLLSNSTVPCQVMYSLAIYKAFQLGYMHL